MIMRPSVNLSTPSADGLILESGIPITICTHGPARSFQLKKENSRLWRLEMFIFHTLYKSVNNRLTNEKMDRQMDRRMDRPSH